MTVPASFLNEPYSTFHKRLDDWLNSSGGEVSDLTLDLYNRAQTRLWMYRAWDQLIQYATLTLSGNVCSTLPDDFGGIICRCGVDTNSDGKFDSYYYKDAPYENGYKLVRTFAKATGSTWAMTFFSTPSSTPTMVYPAVLANFTGDGTEYSFFPPDLLTATAQKIHIQESDLVGDEYAAIINNATELLRDYEQSHQFQNIEQRIRQLDDAGQEVGNEAYDLTAGGDSTQHTHLDNDYDMG